MQFRRSSNVSTTVVPQGRDTNVDGLRRRRRLRLILAVTVVVVGGAVFWFLTDSWVTADGVVVGDLAPVTSLSDEVRVKKLNVKCLDTVSRGQVLAEVENEAVAEAADQQLNELNIELEQARGEADIANQEAQAAKQFYDAQVAVHDQYVTVFKAEDELKRSNYVASLVWEKAKSDVIKAESEMQAASFVIQTKLHQVKRSELEAKLTEERIAAYRASPALLGRYDIVAPRAGYLTQCNAVEGTVVNSDTVLYQVFSPSNAYVVLFADPSDAPRLVVGDKVQMQIDGLAAPVAGEISGFYPELSGLPDSLTRYFWQREKWQQFEPIRVSFSDLSAADQKAIRSSAHVHMSLWRVPEHGVFGSVGHALGLAG